MSLCNNFIQSNSKNFLIKDLEKLVLFSDGIIKIIKLINLKMLEIWHCSTKMNQLKVKIFLAENKKKNFYYIPENWYYDLKFNYRLLICF